MFSPAFKEATFKRLQRQRLEGLKQAKSQPAAVASDVINKINFGENQIMGMNPGGTERTIKNITLQDIENYYSSNMTSQKTKVVVVGDIKENEILPKLAFLGKLPNKKN